MPSGQLTVTPVTMRGLEESGFAESRTFVGCFVTPNDKHRTRSDNGPEPQWNHPLICNVPEGPSALQIELVNEDPEQGGVIGGARVNLNQVFAEGRTEDWISIVGRDFEPIGQIMLVLQFEGTGGEAEGYGEEDRLVAAEGERSMEGEEEEKKEIPDWVKYGGMALAGAAAIGAGYMAYKAYKEHQEEEEEAEAEAEAEGLEVREKDDDSSSSSSSSSSSDEE